jgi:hypothetical protein
MATKACSGPCGRHLPIDRFRLTAGGDRKPCRKSCCRDCEAMRSTEWKRENPERVRAHNLTAVRNYREGLKRRGVAIK